jgi:imidazolonepropionase-like amidohydrolase
MTEAGVNVCIKSDDEELMRHLNLEAAKMVKYGGVSEQQALAMVTINPARELGRDDRLGSIEVGKDADLAIFNGHPLDAFSRCEMALIDGEVYFQRREQAGSPSTEPSSGEGSEKDGAKKEVQKDQAKSVARATMPAAPEAARNRSLEIVAQPKEIFALIGGTLHPVSGPVIEKGILVADKGKITAMGGPGTAIPPEAQTIDVTGLDLWPGLVDGGTTLGLTEVGSLSETQDYADAAQLQPELRTSIALRADSEHIRVTRANGILSAFVQPSGGLIAGQGCVIDLRGWVPEELVIADPVALLVNIPPYVPRPNEPSQGGGPGGGGANEARRQRQEKIERIKELFRTALRYREARDAAGTNPDSSPPVDVRLEAMVPYAKGEKLVIFHAEHRNEILDALDLARELKLKAAITGASGAWKVAGELKKAGVPVLLAGTLNTPAAEHDPYDAPYSAPARLREAGVTFAIRSKGGGPGSATASRNLPYEAATAVAFGLPEDEALRAITLTPAEILGIADQVGSLEVGKRANVVVTAGHILQPTTPVVALFLDGKPIEPESRHTELYRRYRGRLHDVQAGKAPLGIAKRAPAPHAQPAPAAAENAPAAAATPSQATSSERPASGRRALVPSGNR